MGFSRSGMAKLGRAVDFVIFTAFILLICRKALIDLDVGYDNLAYHLPFAALRTGLFARSEYGFGALLESCYAGFPPLQDYIKGGLWKLTGEPNTVNLLSVFVFTAFTLVAHHFTRVPLTFVALATAAIPVIHLQIAGGHVDNLSNLPFALALTLALLAFVDGRRDWLPIFATIVACLCFSANVKLQFQVLSWLFFVPITVFFFFKYLKSGSPSRVRLVFTSVVMLGVISLSWLPIRSFITFGNPIYPIAISVLGFKFPGTIQPSAFDPYGPQYLSMAPNALKWVLSVAEFHAYDLRGLPYSIAQGDVPPDAKSLRMGGFLFSYVLFSIFMFGLLISQMPRRKAIILATGFLLVTGLVALIPSSFELRYFSFWMVSLVLSNLGLLWRAGVESVVRGSYVATCVAAFLFVGSITGYTYLLPQGYSISTILTVYQIGKKIPNNSPPDSLFCVASDKLTVLAAPYFHRDLPPYRIRSYVDPSGCEGGKFITVSP